MEHGNPVAKIVGIKRAAPRRTMRGNNRHATLQRQSQCLWISQRGIHNGHSMFSAGVREQRQTKFRHPFPKRLITPVRTIDVLAIRQTFHQNGALAHAPLELRDRIRSRGMNRHAGEKFRMLPGKPQHEIIGHIHGTQIFAHSSIRIVNLLVRQQDYGIK